MRNSIIVFIIIGILSISCKGQNKKPEIESSKIQLNDLSDKHPNKEQMEFLLNSYKEEFQECEIDSDSLKNQYLIQNQYCFRTRKSDVSVLLFFCEHQKDALAFAEANFAINDIDKKWGVNGATLFVVIGKDKIEVNSVLSHFAGEE
jgi:hypothetical protein